MNCGYSVVKVRKPLICCWRSIVLRLALRSPYRGCVFYMLLCYSAARAMHDDLRQMAYACLACQIQRGGFYIY